MFNRLFTVCLILLMAGAIKAPASDKLLLGEKVGLVVATDGKYEIRFGFHPIGMLDVRLGKVEPKSKKV